MRLDEFISYKTFYYFLKDDSCLDLYFHKDETNKFQFFIDGGFKQEDFYEIYKKVSYGSNDIALLKTKYGTVVFHNTSDNDYVKQFLKTNSTKAPCGVFGSHRVSDTYLIGIAEKGEIVRFLCHSEEEHLLEGTKTTYEKENNIEFKLGEDGFFEDFLDEEDVYNYAHDFLGFDFDEDVEILDFKYYKYELFAKESQADEKVSNDIILKISNNLKTQGIEDITFYITKYRDDKMCDISAIYKDKATGEFYYLFSQNVSNIKNKKLFKNAFNKCLNTLANETDYKKFNKPSLAFYFHTRCKDEFEHDICMGIIDTETPNDLTYSISHINKKSLAQPEILRYMQEIKNYAPKDFNKFHKSVLKLFKEVEKKR